MLRVQGGRRLCGVAPSKKTAARKPRTARRSAAATTGSDPARVGKLLERLRMAIPEPRCELDHRSPWQLLVATILSAQSTDRVVNTVTPELFRRWPTPVELAAAPRAEVEQVVHRTGFFRNKSKSIQGAAAAIASEHGGEVPRELEAMLGLPGVARKTANVVLGTAYGIASGIVVDTHVGRVSVRLGLTQQTDPKKVEAELCALVPQTEWVDTGHRLLLHGRYVCVAKGPRCLDCPLNELCPSRSGEPQGSWNDRARWERARVESGGEQD
jgi:endonuclease III